MYRRILLLMVTMVAFSVSGFISLQSLSAQVLSDQIRECLRSRIEAAGTPPKVTVGDKRISVAVALPRFYEQRTYQPAWSDDNGLLPHVDTLIKAIYEAEREGLRPDDYHLKHIEATLMAIRQSQEQLESLNYHRLVDLDLLLTDAFLLYGSHLSAGRINPKAIDKDWHFDRQEGDLAVVLQGALETNHIAEALQGLLPSHPGYTRLRQALAHYRDIAAQGGWPMVPDGPKMQRGDRSERVAALRARLIASGDLLDQELQQDREFFDETLEQAVRKFQQRHGLDDDGVIGPTALAALNVPVEERVRQIEVSMERWRWVPPDFGQRYVLVNIANFALEVVENGQTVMTMRTIIGKPYRRTPVFGAQISYLVLSPYWHVPPRIAIQDKLPLIRKDPSYLAKQRIKIFHSQDGETREVDPKTIDWSKVTAKNFSYRLRQNPGSINALGRVKFMFPNRFNVYLHDTPSRELFTKSDRAFSSGCVRIEKPLELAEYLLRDDPTWTRERIRAAIDKGVEQTVHLPEPIPVYLLYWTAWADADGTIHFRNDLYGRDKVVSEALRSKSPAV